ncbi:MULTISPECIES: hypothetical protein [unclassified Rhodococcus (in: high G+C Gram-positive bacteria)]|uniref:hypothetical protein n=1 Tax=unclassified Rhodococcus (in: high G+C Gram-positive bacteria) TaxID=192944 RepID=UPI00163966F1|nr:MULTISPECIES: hypothetical protein [unclassified Rhodococcus (in: high G+C Gram-positive bacteria)]MBC2644309.1 hypothetical protein [Rhodococcus sp. 3A]MBC2897998.1 hypothetical protein [Rhodococcus sp. 4CII]
MDMHRDDGIYTATCRHYEHRPSSEGPIGVTTTQHTSRAAAFDALHEFLSTAYEVGPRYDITITRDDTPQREVVFATGGPATVDRLRSAINEARSAYSSAWDILKAHANDLIAELRDPNALVHHPTPELRDVAWAARNQYGPRHRTRDAYQSHTGEALDRAKNLARDAGHTEDQIDRATHADPDMDMHSLRQRSANMIRDLRSFATNYNLPPDQASALHAAADRAEDTVAELAAPSGVPPAVPSLDSSTTIQQDITAAARLAASDFPSPARSVLVSPNQPEPTHKSTAAPTRTSSLDL